MKSLAFISCFGFLLFCCQTEMLKTRKKELTKKIEEPKIITINDSSWYEYLVQEKWIDIKVIQSASHYSMLVNRFGIKDSIDFDKEHITAKTPSFEWMNREFVCITTWWSGPFSSSLIIPIKREDEPFIYFVKGILVSDKKTNEVVYLDRIFGKEKVRFAIESLKTRKVRTVEWKIPEKQHDFPYCDSMFLNHGKLIIWNERKSQNFN